MGTGDWCSNEEKHVPRLEILKCFLLTIYKISTTCTGGISNYMHGWIFLIHAWGDSDDKICNHLSMIYTHSIISNEEIFHEDSNPEAFASELHYIYIIFLL